MTYINRIFTDIVQILESNNKSKKSLQAQEETCRPFNNECAYLYYFVNVIVFGLDDILSDIVYVPSAARVMFAPSL